MLGFWPEHQLDFGATLIVSWEIYFAGLHTCFSCGKADLETEMCAVSSCGRFYHRSCALRIKTTQIHKDRIHCPLHTCATCFAEADDDDIDWLHHQAVRGMIMSSITQNASAGQENHRSQVAGNTV